MTIRRYVLYANTVRAVKKYTSDLSIVARSSRMYILRKLTLDWLIFAKISVIFVRFRGVLRPGSRFYREYDDNVNLLMQMVW